MGLEQWGASEQYYKIASGYPEYELGRVISQEKDLFRVVMDKEECLARVSGKFRYNVMETSGLTGDGLQQIKSYLQKTKTVAFIGSSGVGKSTLIYRLLGEECLKTNTLRKDDKGRHTTTHRELFLIPDSGMVIDTPGMRELGMWKAEEGIEHTFSDIEKLAEKCRFHNCTHTSEPGCAVRAAMEDGIIDEERLKSYKKLKAENSHMEDTGNYMLAKKKKFKEIAKYNKNNLKR